MWPRQRLGRRPPEYSSIGSRDRLRLASPRCPRSIIRIVRNAEFAEAIASPRSLSTSPAECVRRDSLCAPGVKGPSCGCPCHIPLM
jgi:hypothetical protein